MLTYYLDSAFEWVAGADSYALLEDIDDALIYHPRWIHLTTDEKEAYIRAVTSQIDSLDFKGSQISTAQPLQFPRFMSAEGGEFSVRSQARKLLRAVAQQLEFTLNRAGIGVVEYSHGNESMTPRQDTISRETIQTLYVYLR